eukprot:scaffold116_cov334-Pavlova_lutheri.AAC.23
MKFDHHCGAFVDQCSHRCKCTLSSLVSKAQIKVAEAVICSVIQFLIRIRYCMGLEKLATENNIKVAWQSNILPICFVACVGPNFQR